MKKTVWLILFIFLFTALAFAETSLKAEVDKTSITTDENITYKLTITSTEKNVPAPQLPKFEGFNILSQAQSSSVSLSGGNIQTSFVYAYVLAPKAAGKFKIEASQMKIQNKDYATDSFEIEAKQGKAQPQAAPEKKPASPENAQPESQQPQITI